MGAFVEAGPRPQGLSTAWRFAAREMRAGLKGFYILIACIALGVMAISGVNSVSRAMTGSIAAEGQSILGGDISFQLVHREATPEEAAFFRDQGQVSVAATLRGMARRIESMRAGTTLPYSVSSPRIWLTLAVRLLISSLRMR
jgi:putative ABC transport system permease protein